MPDFITVEEAAARLAISVATVRRKLALGELIGEKAGRAWLVDVTKLPKSVPVRSAHGVRAGVTPADIRVAIRHVRSTDLNELWVPDIVRWEDYLTASQETLVAEVMNRLYTANCDPAVEIEVPKTPFFTRAATLLSFEDRVAYQAIVSTIAGRIETRLSDKVYSARLSPDTKYFLKRSTGQWIHWLRDVGADLDDNGPWLVRSDLTAYFDSIDHDLLLADVSSLNPHPQLHTTLRTQLKRWSLLNGRGLSQGPNASRVLGNLFLLPVDEAMESAGHRYWRYMDDVRIVANTRASAVSAIRTFERECRRRGLIVSSAKTEILSGDAAKNEGEDPERATAQYFFDSNKGQAARRALRKILKEATPDGGHMDVGRATFALWRLARLADAPPLGRLLDRLEQLGPVASVSAAYFRSFLQKQRMVTALEQFFHDPERNTSDVLETWLFAAILEHPSALPLGWVSRAREVARDRNAASYHRGLALNVLALGRDHRDIGWIKAEIVKEYDPDVVRAGLTALARVRKLDSGTSQAVTKRLPGLTRTADYLRNRQSLPSLVFRGRTVKVW